MNIYILKSAMKHFDYCKSCGKVSSVRLDGCVILRSEDNIASMSEEGRAKRVPLPEFCECGVKHDSRS